MRHFKTYQLVQVLSQLPLDNQYINIPLSYRSCMWSHIIFTNFNTKIKNNRGTSIAANLCCQL